MIFIRTHFAKIATSFLVAAFAVAALPAIASAQAYGPEQQIQGTIQSINGTWNITVLDANGYLDNVGLHQGTIINPTGLTLAPGMEVTITGYIDGDVLQATEIDTPYQYSGPVPVPVYYGPGWWYPGFAYGYGPSFSLVLNFGGGDHWFVERHPWGGHWWASTPVHGWVGYRAPFYEHERRYPEARSFAPRSYARPEVRSYARPEVRNYSRPETRSYAPPAARYYGGAAQSRTYSAPAARSYAPPAGRSYSGGGRSYNNGGGAAAGTYNRGYGGGRTFGDSERGARSDGGYRGGERH